MARSIRRLLHPTDFSRASRPAFAKALELARDAGAELVLLHVRSLAVPMLGDGYIAPHTYEEIERSSRAAAAKQMNRLVEEAKKRGVRARGVLGEGVPHDQILRTARGQKADLIGMGPHGRTGISKLFLGSVAGKVVSLASCPVVTVRGK